MPTFRTTLRPQDVKDVMGIDVPPDLVQQFAAGKRPKVTVTLKGYTYRSTVAVIGGRFMLPLAREHREAGKITDGETVDVTLELDTAPREVDVPDDLAGALTVAGLRPAFDKLAFTYRKEYVRSVDEAKKPETRAKRIGAIVEAVRAKA